MTTLAELLDTLRRLHLLEPSQLASMAKQWAGQNVDPRFVTKKLVEQGSLTHFQANQLFKGKGSDLLLGSYVLLELLGEGGMGAVYKARNWKLGQIVALKLIRKERLTNPAAVRRFEREIRACAQLNHPNIVRARDADEVNGTHLLVMEYVAGGQDLHKLVREQGRLPIEQACRFLQQAAMGLQHAFERSLVHRDIKPHNLLLASVSQSSSKTSQTGSQGVLTSDIGLVKILDFGLARLGEADDESSTLTQEGSVMGTMDYLAPEQARDSHTADIRSDLYSLGCTMYFLLTGQAPFPGGTAAEKMYKHQFSEPMPLIMLRPEAANGVVDIVDKLMAKRPEDRYQAPAELALDLEAFLAGRPVSASATASSRIRPVEGPDTSQSLQETYNPFAGLSRNETAANEPVATPIATAKLPAPKLPTGNRNRLMLMAAGGAAALVVSIVTLVVVFTRKPPPVANEPKIVHSTPKKPTAIDFAAQGEKLRQEEEAAVKKKKAEEEAARQKWIAEEEAIRKMRAAEAEGPFKLLEAKSKEKDVAFQSFANEVARFKAKHGGTPAAIKAAKTLMRLRSPLDQLDRAKLPQDCVDYWRSLGQEPPQQLVGVLGEHRGHYPAIVRRVVHSPDGKLLAVSGDDRVIRLWDAGTLRPRTELKGAQPVFIQDGKLRALNGTGVVQWEFKDGLPKETVLIKEIPAADLLATTSDGRIMATGHADSIRVWDLSDSTPREKGVLKWPPGHVNALRFTPDNKRLIGGSHDKTVRIWDVEGATLKDVATLSAHGDWVYDVAISPDGKTLASAGAHDCTARLWDLSQPEPKPEAVIPTGVAACAVAFSRNGKVLAVGLWTGQSMIFDLTPDGPKQRFTVGAESKMVWSIAFDADDRRLVTGGEDGTVRQWDLDGGKEVQPLTGHAGSPSVAFSPDCRSLLTASTDRTARLWDVLKGAETQRFDLGQRTSNPLAVFNADGETIAFVTVDRVVLWDVSKRQLRHALPGGNTTLDLAFSPDDRTLATSEAAGAVVLWEVGTGQRLFQLNSPNAFSAAFDPSGRIVVTADNDSLLHLFDSRNGTELRRLDPRFGTRCLRLAFLPDGRRMLATPAGPLLRCWEVDGWRQQWEQPVGPFAVSPEGKRLVAATGEKVTLHDSASGQPLQEWQFPGPVHAVAFANDGRHLATANGNGTVYILRLPPEVGQRDDDPLTVYPGRTVDLLTVVMASMLIGSVGL